MLAPPYTGGSVVSVPPVICPLATTQLVTMPPAESMRMLPPFTLPVTLPLRTVMPESVAEAWLRVNARPSLFASTITASRLPLSPTMVIGPASVSECSW